ncbi:NAD(+) synthase [bacterium]|nr:NAD(+) synthase [bacterium]
MNEKKVINHIVRWIESYAIKSKTKGFVIGISGGIDSAVTSTLVSRTGLPVLCVEMPIHQKNNQSNRGSNHIKWLKKKFNNVSSIKIELTNVFDSFVENLDSLKSVENELSLANMRSRLRMTTLYYYSQINNYLVIGTGNKVEDFGIGFFTKYGDGGVDISPIADLMKTEVYQLAKKLEINSEIIIAAPTDGLWDDDKTDEDQIGATYPELEWAMNFKGNKKKLSDREKVVLKIYKTMNKKNKHKVQLIPVCKIPIMLKVN